MVSDVTIISFTKGQEAERNQSQNKLCRNYRVFPTELVCCIFPTQIFPTVKQAPTVRLPLGLLLFYQINQEAISTIIGFLCESNNPCILIIDIRYLVFCHNHLYAFCFIYNILEQAGPH